MKYLPYLGFALFLIVYSAVKYQAVPSQMGQSTYIFTTIILVVLTALIPYLIGLSMAAKVKLGHPFVTAIIVPFLLSAGGLALYFFLYIKPVAPGIVKAQAENMQTQVQHYLSRARIAPGARSPVMSH